MNGKVMFGLLLAMLAALALRCPNLSIRPMHNDEAVNAIKLQAMTAQGGYRYDPNEHHGPTLYYFALAWTKILGVVSPPQLSEAKLRALTILFGISLILLLPMVGDGLGRGAVIWSGFLLAISTSMVFYSRYFIHEMLLVCFTFLMLAAFWRYYRSGKARWAILFGIAGGLMQSTKETFVLPLAAMSAALLVNGFWTRSGDPSRVTLRRTMKPIILGLGAWAAVVGIFFSSFFSNARGVADSFRSYLPWLDRAAGNSPHIHPWNFYFSRLAWFHVAGGPAWSEGFILMLAVVGVFVAFTGKGRGDSKANFLRFIAFYTVILGVLYSAIAYKTPWCLLGFWHGALLLAGAGAVGLWRLASHQGIKIILAMLLTAGTGHLAFQSWQASGKFSADPRNPYVYAQTSPDILELVDKINVLAAASSQRSHLPMMVSATGNDYWPLPWYLRGFDQVGWFDEMLVDPLPPAVIASAALTKNMEGRTTHQAAGWFELRPGVFLELFVENELWRAYLNNRTPEP